MSRNLRTEMPGTAAWIDTLRAAFGADQIDPSIRAGMKGGTSFHASENGHEIGRKDEMAGIPLSQCQLTRDEAFSEAASAKNARRGK
jgi:hypothetical protein